MKKIISSVISGALVITTIIGVYSITGNITPRYQEFNETTLTNGESTSLELGDINLIACFGSPNDNQDFWLNNTHLDNLDDYVIHKTLEFETNKENGKLKISEIKCSDDTLAKAICLKAWVGEEFYELRDISKFEGYTFNSVDTCEIMVWLELSQITKEEILNSKGTSLEINFEVE